MKKVPVLVTFLYFSLSAALAERAVAQQIINFGPRETRIIGSIPYTVIGHYQAQFSSFKGRIGLDDHDKVRSVYLEIEANTIKSSCQWCDKLARSHRLLDTVRYPKIIFKSDEIIDGQEGYQVKGILQMHGIRRKMLLPFQARVHGRRIEVKGLWVINRKDFNIIWSRRLDHGGVVVGDDFTVDWSIRERI